VAVTVLGPLEMLNRTLKSKAETVAGMMKCINLVANERLQPRYDNKFVELVSKCNVDAELMGLKSLTVPRVRKPPARFKITAEAHLHRGQPVAILRSNSRHCLSLFSSDSF
jgi:hypothetical protein